MYFDGFQVTLHSTDRVTDPAVLPPNRGAYPEEMVSYDRTHPQTARCHIRAFEGEHFYLDFTSCHSGEDMAILVSAFGINPVTGQLATRELAVRPQNYYFYDLFGDQPARNRYADGWVIPGTGVVSQFFWTRRGGRADEVARRLGLLVPPGVDTTSDMLSVAVYTAVGQIKGLEAFGPLTRRGGQPGVGSGGAIIQNVNADSEIVLHGVGSLARWPSQPAAIFVWHVDVASPSHRPYRPEMGGDGFYKG